ncbi:hypothetical protein Sta7437_0648 [Stanieria cyanosphaera PCC 7437]|uniref:Uncharacterized protein n=1 Tax=Stanieria cyanosphaera (strain ATCC 29371 / PCC 7437) TaxID=111780 RepID=K9XNZ2_STAC7|nr:hypothetical protein [Stanieria cyanosphaera]AFZ34243.1 hypothetical protein Sta7437_0648 [Stanieria cyanosphaera PCC 7437]
MDTLQLQIREINQKIDQLHQMVERLSSQVNTLMAAKQKHSEPIAYSLAAVSQLSNKSAGSHYETGDYSLAHKDILVDDDRSQPNPTATKEQELSPDIQIRRLTAQLTAAYNRIAALEEQLLTYRIQS